MVPSFSGSRIRPNPSFGILLTLIFYFLRIIVNLSDYFRRYAACHAVVRHILCYHGPGSDHDIVADCYAGQDRTVRADPHVTAYGDGFGLSDMLPPFTGRQRMVHSNDRRVGVV